MSYARPRWPLAVLAGVLTSILVVTLLPYGGNLSALFHLDTVTADLHGGVPKNFVVLKVPGYDGEQYYEIARNMIDVFRIDEWPKLAQISTIAYSYQRFLLPLLAFILSVGQVTLLPYTFLAIQLASLFAVCSLMLRAFPRKPLYALALALCPAAMIGLHFSLAEPLTLALLTTFLVRFTNRQSIHTLDVILLSLFVLSREVNILFVGLLIIYLLFKKQWKDVFLMIIPLATFLTLHTLIYGIFHEIPFLWSTDKHSLPGEAITDILLGRRGYTMYTLSSIALFLGFVLPGLIWSGWNLRQKGNDLFLPLFTLAFFCLMLLMPDHIWGSITSIGRVITPIYPLCILQAAEHDSVMGRFLAGAVLCLGLGIAFALALIPHPFFFA